MLRSERGAAFASLLVVLLILGALYLGYLGLPQGGGKRGVAPAALDASRGIACRVQRQQLEREIGMWKVEHPGEDASIAALNRTGVRIPSCPEGGNYDIQGSSVTCSLHK